MYEYKRCANCGYETEYASEIEYCYTCEQAYLKGFNKAQEGEVKQMIVWKSELTSEMIDEHLSTDELAELAYELDKAIEEICKSWGVE